MRISRDFRRGISRELLRDAREKLYEAISSKLGAVPEDISKKVKSIEERETLRAMLRQAILSETLDTFREALKKV